MASITSPEQGAQHECSSSLSWPPGRDRVGRVNSVMRTSIGPAAGNGGGAALEQRKGNQAALASALSSRSCRAAATSASSAARVSGQPRVLSPQSGFTQI